MATSRRQPGTRERLCKACAARWKRMGNPGRRWLLAGLLLLPPGSTAIGPGGTTVTTIPQRSGYATTPFSLSGQTVCQRGAVTDVRDPVDRRYWFDGATVGLPGHRCITLR